MKQVIYGRQPVWEALRARKRSFEKLILRQGVSGEIVTEIIRIAKQLQIPIEWQTEEDLEKMVGKVVHQGVVLVSSSRRSRSWQELLEEVAGNTQAVVGFVDRVEDPRNLGAIIRTAAFFGFRGLLVSKAHTAPLYSQGVKASCGGVEFIDLFQVNDFLGILRAFKKRGVFFIGMEEDAPAPIWDVDVQGVPLGLVVGGEDKGIRRIVRTECDFLVKIPSWGAISSLNVSVAFAIGAYEIIKQKRSVLEVEKR
ncbi:MAG: 23S rRNA (guanosine(2251)-2'-O)-methyltransferase RlmB [Candidatus Caldatribacteriaceae bacterium]